MTVLCLVPNAYLRHWRRKVTSEGKSLLPMTMPGLVAQILKEGLVSYKEDGILEEMAVWQGVQDNLDTLEFFAPIAHYPGFIQELKWLFRQIDLGEEVFRNISKQGQAELGLLHATYHDTLKKHGIIDGPGQIARALELTQGQRFFSTIEAFELRGLGELSPLENELLASLAQERPLKVYWSEVAKPAIEVLQAADPAAEIEMIGLAIRSQIEMGVPLEKIGVAFPNPAQYLPILLPVFKKLGIPWKVPTTSLRNTPLGKAILTLIAGELEGWHKHHLQLLTAPGWGFPFDLSGDEHRLLRLGPPLKGLPAWRHYLGEEPGWERVIQFLIEAGEKLVAQPLREYGVWLEALLEVLQPERWVLPEQNLENWAELMKAWDGLETISESFKQYEWVSSPGQFLQLLQTLFDSYQIQARRVFAEQVQIMSIEQLGGYTYDLLYVGGLVEGQFPHYKHAHWLTKTRTTVQRDELYQRLINVAPKVYLSYPEVDREGKLNLPATILPKQEEDASTVLTGQTHYPSLFFGNGILGDKEILASLQAKVLLEGLSVSQLNSYANCPYQFFCGHVLGLTPDEEASLEPDARVHGTIIHNVLQSFWNTYLEGPLPTIDEGQTQLEGLLEREYAKEGALPSARIIRTMRDFIRKDLKMAEGGFRPRYLEKWFQGLNIKTPLGPVEIRGRIDRIDLHPDGAYVLYDYKTGTAPTINSMLAGGDVQMAAYLLAAQDLLAQGRSVGVAYYLTSNGRRAGIFHQDFQKPLGLRKGPNILDEEEFVEQNNKFVEILEGLVGRLLQGEFPIEPTSSRICSFCPFQGICRKEVGF